MAILKHLLLGFFFGACLMLAAELSFAMGHSHYIQEDTLQIDNMLILQDDADI